MLKIVRLLKYLSRSLSFIFTSVFWRGGLYSLMILLPAPLYHLFNKKNSDVLAGLACRVNSGFKVTALANDWQVEMGGQIFI